MNAGVFAAAPERLVVVAEVQGELVGAAKTHLHRQPDGVFPAGHYLGGVMVNRPTADNGRSTLILFAQSDGDTRFGPEELQLLVRHRTGVYSGPMTPSHSAAGPADPRRLTARITGEVQAVGFRYRTLQQATRLGLTGVVSNRSDGSVQVVAEGEPADIDALLQWLASPAAPGAVTGVEQSLSEATGEFPDFRTD